MVAPPRALQDPSCWDAQFTAELCCDLQFGPTGQRCIGLLKPRFLVDPARQRGLLGFGSHLCALLRRTEASGGAGGAKFPIVSGSNAFFAAGRIADIPRASTLSLAVTF